MLLEQMAATNTALFVRFKEIEKDEEKMWNVLIKKTRNKRHTIINASFLSACLLLLFLSGCFNNQFGDQEPVSTRSIQADETGDALEISLILSRLEILRTGGGSDYSATLYFDRQKSTHSLDELCSKSGGSRPCRCRFDWEELNQTSGTIVTIARSVSTSLSLVQPGLVSCTAPSVYESEIAEGTRIKIYLVSERGNSQSFTAGPYSHEKGQSSAGSDFQDREGRGFLDIHRYTCFEKISRGMSISNRVVTDVDGAGITRRLIRGDDFCVTNADGQTDGDPSECSSPPVVQTSAESYYYNLYITSANRGGFNSQNSRYVCPLVKESLNGSSTIGEQNKPWPMDSAFALARNPSSDYPVGVQAPSVLGLEGDPASGPTSCFGGSGEASGGGISSKCLGFAAKPNENGTCPSIRVRDSAGVETSRETYRLRRMIALYPPSFNTDGDMIQQPAAVDMVYTLDRPVKDSSGKTRFTMMGPKPCNFAYFDHSGVTEQNTGALGAQYHRPHGGLPGYYGTNNSVWDKKNIDGIALPFRDRFNSQEISCAATVPIVRYDDFGDVLGVSLATTLPGSTRNVSLNGDTVSLKKLFIRPTEPWAPHYIEDESFQACAPRSSNFQDPPLHFARDAEGEVAYCAAVYPTQNPYMSAIDQVIDTTGSVSNPGHVKPFTSPVVKNVAGGRCTATQLDNYTFTGTSQVPGCAPGEKMYQHNDQCVVDTKGEAGFNTADLTCDRTVSRSTGGSWRIFPLQAPPEDIETMLVSDPSYRCSITWDDGEGLNGRTPSSGCCDSQIVRVTTDITSPDTAHLDPRMQCGIPTQ
jgi:hypothetical protein